MSIVRVSELSKVFGEKDNCNKVLDNVSFEIEKGEFVSLMGASGSGKSTLLYLIGALDKPSSGEVFINDKKINNLKEKEISKIRRKEIGFVLSENYWGKGIMTESAKMVTDFAFRVLDVPVIYIGHAEANIGSGKVQDKIGFKVIGKLPNYRIWVDGKPTDLIERKLTKEEWLNKE